MLEQIVKLALSAHASDAHLESGLPLTLRVRGNLKSVGEPLDAATLRADAEQLLGPTRWQEFLGRRSFDLSKTIAGVRCRINVLQSSRGIGFAIRFLARFDASLYKLNVHPDVAKLAHATHGLILVSGATGSGKTSTLAGMIQEINSTEARHIITIESPIEYTFNSHKAFIRQREVGRDTPSFEQALRDALREDPDVVMVGEMRDPETMRLTLSAAETGHLVLATLHSSTVSDALARIVGAFPAEAQSNVSAQLADVLVAVVCQQLVYREDLDLLLPECEILLGGTASRAVIRQTHFSKLATILETGAGENGLSRARYKDWLQRKTDFYRAGEKDVVAADEPHAEAPQPLAKPLKAAPAKKSAAAPSVKTPNENGVIEIDEELDPASILSSLK